MDPHPSKLFMSTKINEIGYYSDGELIEDPNAAQGLDIDPLSEESMNALKRLARFRPPPDPCELLNI